MKTHLIGPISEDRPACGANDVPADRLTKKRSEVTCLRCRDTVMFTGWRS